MSAVRCATAVLLFCGLTFAQAAWKLPQRNSAALIEPRALITRFCQMDADGFRLDPEKARRMQDATTWKTIPELTRFDIISNMVITPPKAGADSLRVTVTYNVLGTYILGAGYTPEPHTDTVEYEVVQQDDGWKISATEEMATPHVQRARAYRWLREQATVARSPEAKAILEDALKQLQP